LLDDEKLIGGWAEATPEGWTVPMRKEVNLKRYIKKTKEGVVTRFWSTDNQPEQIAKVAESQMLRAAWPDEFQGLYVDSEIQSRNAQEDLDAAVSTATPIGDRVEGLKAVFDEVYKAELDDPFLTIFLDLGAKGATPPLTIEQAKAEIIDRYKPEEFRKLFMDWKKRSPTMDKAMETKPETSAPVNGDSIKAPAETSAETKEPPADDFRSRWINLKEAGFSTFVFKNIDQFRALQGDALKEAVAKWAKIYPTFQCPFVAKKPAEDAQEATGEAQGEVLKPAGEGTATDPMENELVRLRAELAMHTMAHGAVVQQAKHDTGISAPQTIDGYRVLLEAVEAILKERK